MSDTERLSDKDRVVMIREALDQFNTKREPLYGPEIDDYVYFVEAVETALADRIDVVFDDEPF